MNIRKFKKKYKLFTLCQNPICNKEYEVLIPDSDAGVPSVFQLCPHCGNTNQIWIKIDEV